MPKIKKTRDNPHGLSAKQRLSVEKMADDVKEGKPLDPVKTTEEIYDVSSTTNARNIASRNLKNPDFRLALLEGLKDKNILGKDGKVEKKLVRGLDANKKRAEMVDRDANGKPIYAYVEEEDFPTILKYIQEINKIAGVYAPEKRESKKLILKADVTEEQLDEKIKKLQDELRS